MGCGTCTLKFLVLVQSILIWVASALLLYVGVRVVQTYDVGKEHVTIGSSQLVLTPAIIILVCGSVLFIVGLVGIFGALCKNKYLLGTFFAFLLIVVALEVAAAVFAGAYSDTIYKDVQEWARSSIAKYYSNDTNVASVRNDVNYIQTQLHCCGAESYLDWIPGVGNATHNVSSNSEVPESCCKDQSANCTVPRNQHEDTSDINTVGCVSKLKNEIEMYKKYIIGFAVGIAVIQLIGLISTCVLCAKKRNDDYENLA